MNIAIIGTGYVGLPTGLCLSKMGNNVICIDCNEEIIKKLQNKQPTIYENDLEKMLLQEDITFSTNIKDVLNAEIIIIAVGTPTAPNGISADLTYMDKVFDELNTLELGNKIIAIKSTVPIGTNDKYYELLKYKHPKIQMVSYPEFLREGFAISDFLNPDRIIFGVRNKKTADIMSKIYPLYYRNRIIITDVKSAELIKYASNAFLAIKINYINEIANLCESVGANIDNVSNGIGADSRIGNKFLKAGPGYGGSCFPKDTLALIDIANRNGITLPLVEIAIKENNERRKLLADKIINELYFIDNKKVAILGLSFKSNTDDFRESPSLDIIKYLQEHNIIINGYDKNKITIDKIRQNNDFAVFSNVYNACVDCSAIVLMNDDVLNDINLKTLYNIMADGNKFIFDLRGIIDVDEVSKIGFTVYKVGVNKCQNNNKKITLVDRQKLMLSLSGN